MTPQRVARADRGVRSARVLWPVVLAAAAMVAALLAVSGAYGFHGDEMYYVVAGRHPAFGYVDQPPLTPLLSAASVALLGVSPTAVRVLPALEMGVVVILVGLICRDFGGSRRAQVLAAVTAAVSGYLGAGHLDTTTEPDLLAWAVILALVVRLLDGGDRRLWLVVGAASGLGLQNKDTLLFLGAGLAVGIVAARRWDVVRSRWPWAGLGIALLLWAPNLLWQAANGWPQLTMAGQIAGYGADNRAQALPLLWLFTGPLLFPVSAAGLVWLWKSSAAAPWRAIGWATPVALALVVLTGGKAYYAIGSTCVLMAAGGIVLDGWLARSHRRLRTATFTVAAALSGLLIVVLTLPVLPIAAYAKTTLPATVPDTANQVGWPQFVATVHDVVEAMPPDQRAHAVILTNDYSEASPLLLLGTGLPPVYSGHNAYWSWGPPPADRTLVVHVGDWRPADWDRYFVDCHDVAHIDNRLGVDNSEQGTAVTICSGIRAPWTVMWPALRTIS
ncbi:MAG: glycosyltransferase family 39 protein [Lapillicoccus sp.]